MKLGSGDVYGWATQLACQMMLQVLFGQLLGLGIKGRPRDSWWTVVHKHLSAHQVEFTWYKITHDRTAWRQLIATVYT